MLYSFSSPPPSHPSSFLHLPVLNEVIFVFDLSPCPILKGSLLRSFRLVNEARLSKPSRVLAREDLPEVNKDCD